MACPSFDVKVNDVKATLDKIKKAIAGLGSLSGDEKKGTFILSDSSIVAGKYTIKGSYTVDSNVITITNDIQAQNPDIVTCKRVTEKMQGWLK